MQCRPRFHFFVGAPEAEGEFQCIKRERTSFSCTQEKPYHRLIRIHDEKMRPYGHISTHISSVKSETVVVFLLNDLSALMLTLGTADFSPPHQSPAVSARTYLRKTP